MQMTRSRSWGAALLAALAAAPSLAACGSDGGGGTAGHGGSTATGSGGTSTGGTSTGGAGGAAPLPTGLSAKITKTRFLTADAMLASIEMQISGEPFAELLGRDLGGYDRLSATTDNYTDPSTGMPGRDPLGFSLAVESYEYSKQAMNSLSFEAGAGLALMYGPVLNPAHADGDPAFVLLRDRLQYLALASRASGAKVGKDFVTSPAPTNDPTNYYGWPGFWPVFAEYRSFDPAIKPSVGADHSCSLAGAIDEPLPPGAVQTYVGDYECDSNTLGLVDREAQTEKVLEPAALGLAAWKQSLWTINYWSSFHDVDQHPIIKVAPSLLAQAGTPANTVIGQWVSPLDPTGNTLVFGKDGTYFGDVSLEGWQGLVMLDEIDNKSAFLLRELTSGDGKALSGFATVGDAIDYDYAAPLRFWPAAVTVTEAKVAATPAETRKLFPKPTAFAVTDGTSRLADLTGLLGGFATAYAMTDEGNADVGGTQPFLATFDGAPLPTDNGLADGEDTLHDRALGILKVALVDLDRLHFDAQRKALAGTATVGAGGVVTRGATVSTFDTAYSIAALRTALRALSSSLTLYSNDTPDTLGVPTPLDGASLAGAPFTGSLTGRVAQLIWAQADLLADQILDADGLAANGYDLGAGARDASAVTIEAQSAAIRGLLEAYLATSDEKYRQRAVLAYQALDQKFWMDDVRAFRTTAGESVTMTWTPRSFGALHGALRQFWKLHASKPGKEELAKTVLDRILRGMKLVVNGWNDANHDELVQPTECLGGRLQMAERALTGELSVASDMGDRDHDCVPDIATAGLPAALAAEMVIERK
jgi:hypothetical protein